MSIEQPSRAIGSPMMYSRLIGALFLAGFIVYGAGSAMVTSVVGDADFLSTVASHRTTLVLGAFLMLLVTVIDVGKAIAFFPILEDHGRRTALTYLATMIVEVVLMAVGALVLLMLVPLAEESADAGPASGGWADALGALAVDANEVAYQSSQMLLAIGALFLCALLYRARLVPRFLAAWGLFGYATHMVGAIAEIFGVHVSLLLLIPGGVFEIVLGFWLIIKGFRREGYGGDSQVLSGPAVRPAPAKL